MFDCFVAKAAKEQVFGEFIARYRAVSSIYVGMGAGVCSVVGACSGDGMGAGADGAVGAGGFGAACAAAGLIVVADKDAGFVGEDCVFELKGCAGRGVTRGENRFDVEASDFERGFFVDEQVELTAVGGEIGGYIKDGFEDFLDFGDASADTDFCVWKRLLDDLRAGQVVGVSVGFQYEMQF